VGAAAAGIWYARTAWSSNRSWAVKLWSAALAVATVSLLYVAVMFRLIAFDANF
jgi:hypothetical protein